MFFLNVFYLNIYFFIISFNVLVFFDNLRQETFPQIRDSQEEELILSADIWDKSSSSMQIRERANVNNFSIVTIYELYILKLLTRSLATLLKKNTKLWLPKLTIILEGIKIHGQQNCQ